MSLISILSIVQDSPTSTRPTSWAGGSRILGVADEQQFSSTIELLSPGELPKLPTPDHKPAPLRWPFFALLLTFILSLVGLVELAVRIFPPGLDSSGQESQGDILRRHDDGPVSAITQELHHPFLATPVTVPTQTLPPRRQLSGFQDATRLAGAQAALITPRAVATAHPPIESYHSDPTTYYPALATYAYDQLESRTYTPSDEELNTTCLSYEIRVIWTNIPTFALGDCRMIQMPIQGGAENAYGGWGGIASVAMFTCTIEEVKQLERSGLWEGWSRGCNTTTTTSSPISITTTTSEFDSLSSLSVTEPSTAESETTSPLLITSDTQGSSTQSSSTSPVLVVPQSSSSWSSVSASLVTTSTHSAGGGNSPGVVIVTMFGTSTDAAGRPVGAVFTPSSGDSTTVSWFLVQLSTLPGSAANPITTKSSMRDSPNTWAGPASQSLPQATADAGVSHETSTSSILPFGGITGSHTASSPRANITPGPADDPSTTAQVPSNPDDNTTPAGDHPSGVVFLSPADQKNSTTSSVSRSLHSPTSPPPKATGMPSYAVSVTGSEYLAGLFLPVLLTTLLTIPINILNSHIKLALPFRMLAKAGESGTGIPARDSVSMEPVSFLTAMWTSLRITRLPHRDPVSLIGSLLVVLSSCAVPLSAASIGINLSCSVFMVTNPVGETKVCFMRLGFENTTVRIVETLAVLMAVLVVCEAFLLVRWRTGVPGSAWNLAYITGILQNATTRRMFREITVDESRTKRSARKELFGALEMSLFSLRHYRNDRGAVQYGLVVENAQRRSPEGRVPDLEAAEEGDTTPIVPVERPNNTRIYSLAGPVDNSVEGSETDHSQEPSLLAVKSSEYRRESPMPEIASLAAASSPAEERASCCGAEGARDAGVEQPARTTEERKSHQHNLATPEAISPPALEPQGRRPQASQQVEMPTPAAGTKNTPAVNLSPRRRRSTPGRREASHHDPTTATATTRDTREGTTNIIFLLILLGILIIIIYYDTTVLDTPFERFMDSQSLGVKFLFSGTGVAVSFFWESTFQLTPFLLHRGCPPPEPINKRLLRPRPRRISPRSSSVSSRVRWGPIKNHADPATNHPVQFPTNVGGARDVHVGDGGHLVLHGRRAHHGYVHQGPVSPHTAGYNCRAGVLCL
ncbi:hypothetical protein B0H66DRAFT_538610 [Apodospora peruviana]|uniref:Uncharacterized protein n=1 Tax=Apodospora peruviana TaxID=516989 RepID=A0AAE0LY96_9PEZI|nr:hypothetical protein B0H66DRAFT_538610 [Apodospora peruviana]